jgi:hypothetical protein
MNAMNMFTMIFTKFSHVQKVLKTSPAVVELASLSL